jgi:hypothetical protein
MSNFDHPHRPKRQRRRHIYYKVQVFDQTSLTWRDEKDAFDDEAAARGYMVTNFEGKTTRIMVVDGKKRYPLPTPTESP